MILQESPLLPTRRNSVQWLPCSCGISGSTRCIRHIQTAKSDTAFELKRKKERKMMIMSRMLLSLLCFVALVYGQASPDTATMLALRDSLQSTRLNWSDPNPCLWTGLGCDRRSHRVTRIQIGNTETSGALTSDLRNLSSLTVFEVMGNKLTGKIPSLAGLRSLERVFLNDNGFTTMDADFFTGLNSLHYVNLGNNPMRPWEIPFSLRDANSLLVFSAVNCNLSGTIPHLTFPNLTSLELSGNHLVGELPVSFAESRLQILKLDGQKLNGSISVLQKMPLLTEVSLHGNRFSGTIPDLSGLTSLRVFDVSENQLTGGVPNSLIALVSLTYVALGNNLLQGSTPLFLATAIVTINGGSSSSSLSLSIISLFSSSHTHPQHYYLFQSPMGNQLALIIISLTSSCFFLLILTFLILICRRRPPIENHPRRPPSSTTPDHTFNTVNESFDPSLYEISMEDLSIATKNFSSDLIVGDGSFGFVYRAKLSNDVVVAVKKLDPDALQGFREFSAEMETLGQLRHPNIVRILGYCISGPDRVLIYEFLEKGSLDYWLHETDDSYTLSWSNRVNIAYGVAKGLAYLHGLPKPIIHRDIKSSNVLLDSDFVAHIADFGLARRMDESRSHVSTQVAGTMGYMPPEYWGGNTAATVKADVYSFGILMLETATQRRPNLPVVVEGEEVGLAQWAVMLEGQNRYFEMVYDGVGVGDWEVESVDEYFKIACLCIKESTRERPTMNQVVELLEELCSAI
ncbi:hypothetical protein AALP_AA6G306900 [Arabis alpina]|uniref:Protein kinase domain-containing protein n=1 Tax=Arabis alpina TaxID=50452 RepID=A0A087GSS1_ARAAL|nr:hypothetical protein AALP_AA6G306900 [Arabis alpina]